MDNNEDLDQLVANLKPSQPVKRFIARLSSERNVEGRRRADYISLSPQPVGAVAVYCHTNRVSIAVDAHKAAGRKGAMPYANFRKKTPATTYVIVFEEHLEKHFETVLELASESVDWRALGLKLTGHRAPPTGKPKNEPETCPTCWCELTPAGTCLCD